MNKILVVTFTAIIFSGCSTFRSYNDELKPVVNDLSHNNPSNALTNFESHTSSNKDLLHYLEKGEIQRLNKNYNDSIATWNEADKIINEWENGAKITSEKVTGTIGSAIINDKVLAYEGEDYEKVMLSTRQALNYLALGKTEDALVEMKKTWEREALIKELHDKEFTESENEAKAKGYKTDISELKGYPIETLNNPEVQSLKNGYQNAFSQYISGFLAEASGDVGNAAAGYRTAIELQPNLISIKQHLADLDARMTQKNTKTVQTITEEKNVKTESKYKKVKDKKKSHSESKEQNSHLTSSSTLQNLQAPINNQSDVLIVVENGISPKRTGITIPLPIPSAGLVPISFPLLENEPISANKAISIRLPDNTITNLDLITSIDAMARRSLKDHLPYIMVRAAIRGAIKGAAQAVAYKENTFAGLAVNAINIATEQADERIWKLLPADILIARVHLPEGSHSIKLLMSDGEHSVDIKVSGKYSVVPIRVVGQAIYTL